MGKIRNLSQLLNALENGYKVTKSTKTAAPGPEKDERHFCISVAGKKIDIDSLYSEVYSLCENYLCEGEADIHVRISEEDIAYEREEAKQEHVSYGDSYLETLAVYRKIAEALLEYDIFLMHGAVVAEGQDAYMFTAKSGTGKTTHIQKWLKNLENGYVVNGDKPLIRITDTEVEACGTPWCGKEKMNKNCIVPLRAIVFMERGENNTIKEINYSEAFQYLLQQTYQPNNADGMRKMLKLLMRIKGKVRFYRHIFNNMKEDAFDVSYGVLTGGKE